MRNPLISGLPIEVGTLTLNNDGHLRLHPIPMRCTAGLRVGLQFQPHLICRIRADHSRHSGLTSIGFKEGQSK